MEELKYLQLPFPVDVEFCHPAVQPHKNTTRILERTDEAADQLVGDSFCELLEWEQKAEEMKSSVTLRNSARISLKKNTTRDMSRVDLSVSKLIDKGCISLLHRGVHVAGNLCSEVDLGLRLMRTHDPIHSDPVHTGSHRVSTKHNEIAIVIVYT